MKNFILLIFLSLLTLLCSCNNEIDDDTVTENPDNLEIDYAGNVSPNDSSAPNPPNSENPFDSVIEPNFGEEVHQLTIESYDKYLLFLESDALPKDFVKFEDIANFGQFDCFVCLTDARDNDYSWYMYGIVDNEDVSFVVYVRHLPQSSSENDNLSTITRINRNDMRKIDSASTGKYVEAGIEYSYVQGKLSSISWDIKNISYTIGNNLSEYPVTSDTQIGKLLSIQNAINFVDSLKNKIVITE